jgi:RNase P/RNase MRP subunit p30
MINVKDLQQAKNLIRKEEHPIIVRAQNLEFNRKILEYGKFDVLVGVEFNEERDKLRGLSSGFNHVLARITAKNKVALGIDLEEIRGLDRKQKAIILGRIRQNIKFCRKVKCSIVILNYKDEKDAFEVLISLGASTEQAKQSVT